MRAERDAPRMAAQNAGALLSSVSLPVSGRSVKVGGGDATMGFRSLPPFQRLPPPTSELIYLE